MNEQLISEIPKKNPGIFLSLAASEKRDRNNVLQGLPEHQRGLLRHLLLGRRVGPGL